MMKFEKLRLAMIGSLTFLQEEGVTVHPKRWQGIDSPAPMFEAEDLMFKAPIPKTWIGMAEATLPNFAWADKHFGERVAGIPVNPPLSHLIWPFGRDNNKYFTSGKGNEFDHSYPERFWPKYAGMIDTYEDEDLTVDSFIRAKDNRSPNKGIRFSYGDFQDVINLLADDPETRQAYLPIFFPEDTGSLGGKHRVPCTLGYHFMIRDNMVHIKYPMRSCDAFRHFPDDIYMACRLADHVRKILNTLGHSYDVGDITFTAYSFHIFEPEIKLLEKRIRKYA